MSKSKKRKSTRKQKRKPPMPAGIRKLKQAGYQVRAFQIVDEISGKPKPDIVDDMMSGTILMKKGRRAEAKAIFESVIARDPQVREAYNNLAAIHISAGDQKTGEAILYETMEKFPRYPYPCINLAYLHLRRGQVEEAEALLKLLDKINKFTSGEFRFYTLTWSDILAAKGQYKAALSWLKVLSQLLPGSRGILWRRIRYTITRLFKRDKKEG